MICPGERASDMSAFRAARISEHARHVELSEGRNGADDESTGSDVAGHGEEDYVVECGGDTGYQRPAFTPNTGPV